MWIAIAVGVGVPALFVLIQFNRLVGLRNYIRNAWGNIDTELKRRYELIPNLVKAVKAYATHERTLFERVTELRSRCLNSNGPPVNQASDEAELVQCLQRLLLLAESYPDLKADRNFLDLQKALVNTEDRIQAARRFYNGNVRDYLVKCESFPSNLVAGFFGFEPEAYFSVEPAVKSVPNVDFD
jgi:LemA protein